MNDLEFEKAAKKLKNTFAAWDFFNDASLKELGYESPMDMPEDVKAVHAANIAKGMDAFNKRGKK